MIDLKNRKILEDGTVICSEESLIEILYTGKDINGVFCNNMQLQEEWKSAAKICDSQDQGPVYVNDTQYQHINWYEHWFTPKSYQDIDLRSWCLKKCRTEEQKTRVNYEIDQFENRNMLPIMKHLIYCVDVWRQNNIVWGVGRGSSVSSYVLYLIGINRIDPLEFDLNIHEWLK